MLNYETNQLKTKPTILFAKSKYTDEKQTIIDAKTNSHVLNIAKWRAKRYQKKIVHWRKRNPKKMYIHK